MITHLASAVVLALVLVPVVAPSSDLRLEMKRERPIVLPRPSDRAVADDTERARQQARAAERREQVIRESRQRPLSRPELDYSITNAIQAARAAGALRR